MRQSQGSTAQYTHTCHYPCCLLVKCSGMQVAEAAPGPSAGSPAVLLGLTALVAGGVLLAKQTQPQSDGKSGGGRGGSPSASKGAAASSAPQSAGAYVLTCFTGPTGSTAASVNMHRPHSCIPFSMWIVKAWIVTATHSSHEHLCRQSIAR